MLGYTTEAPRTIISNIHIVGGRMTSKLSVLAVSACLVALAACSGSSDGPAVAKGKGSAAVVTFQATDKAGSWFDCSGTASCITYGGEKSLAIVHPGATIAFASTGQANTLHTAVSLIWPSGAHNMPFDVDLTPPVLGGDQKPFTVNLVEKGLYVFYCDIHPYMFGAVIVDDPSTTTKDADGNKVPAYDLGETIDVVVAGNTIPTSSDLATRLLRTFFIATDPTNWKDYTSTAVWHITYPSVPVRITGGAVANLNDVLSTRYGNDTAKAALKDPTIQAVGEVWVDTQFELTSGKDKPGTVTSVEGQTWKTTRKVALNLNNPHNLWTNEDQSLIYQTEWFDNYLTVFNRTTGAQTERTLVGPAPAHVMTRTNNGDVHVSLNGANDVVELLPGGAVIRRNIPMSLTPGESTHPHAHWMSFDGSMMVTPNPDTEDSTMYHFDINPLLDKIVGRTPVGHFPIATGMMPKSEKYYVANFLDSTISVIGVTGFPSNPAPAPLSTINLLGDYDPIGGTVTTPYGGFPIQTPVSPDGKYMLTANTLTATVTIVDTNPAHLATVDTVVAMIHCEPGCHGVQFGAKLGGGYYAYVSSKFTNVMLVIDLDAIVPGGTQVQNDAAIVGRILITGDGSTVVDRTVSGNPGMGGQGVLPIPLVYNGWAQKLPAIATWPGGPLTSGQRNPS
jgi:DNA-binding beta-propeller fold protein YncE